MNKRVNITSSLFDPSMMRSSASTPELELSRQIYQAVRSSAEGIITITPALAQRILDLLNFGKQRRLKPHNVMSLKSVILNGQWDSTHPICFARMKELLIGVNLQHRMHAIVGSNTAVSVRVIITERESDDAIVNLYNCFDQQRGSRGETDAIVARDLAGDTGMSLTMVRTVMNALRFILNDMNSLVGGTMTMEKTMISMVETRIAEFPKWIDQAQKWKDVTHKSPAHVRDKLKNAGVCAVGLYTLKHQPEIAEQFWMGLAENDKLAKTDPRARLLADFQARKGATTREIVQAAAHAWNAWYEGRTLASIRCDPGAPLYFAGTPLANRKK